MSAQRSYNIYFKKIWGEILVDTNTDQNEFLFAKRHLRSTKNIIKYNKPDTTSALYNLVKRCVEIGPKFSLEKHIIMYGEDLGTKKFNSSLRGVTLDIMIQRHGVELGTAKYNDYLKKQAYTNSFEYKNKKYGMSKEEFDSYNKSRAVTLDNMIDRYGDTEGRVKYKLYCERQAYTNSEEYLGTERYKKVCSQKKHTLENYIRKYGEKEGTKRFHEFINNSVAGYSKDSQKLFWMLLEHSEFKNSNVYFAEYNKEYGIYDSDTKKYKKYDFVSLTHNLCIEYNGDHYHGNPTLYLPSDNLKGRGVTKITAIEKWSQDEYKNNLIKKERGINVITVWESDFKRDPEAVIKRIIEYVQSRT